MMTSTLHDYRHGQDKDKGNLLKHLFSQAMALFLSKAQSSQEQAV